ncbi:hypothetical protein D9M69_452220 [compost metagenome]
MVWHTLETKLSTPRMNRYLKGHQGKQDLAAQAYVHNMRIAESLVSIFHVLEVGLRNGIQREMAREFKRDDWYEELDGTGNNDLQTSYAKVVNARAALNSRGAKLTPDDITAEMSFGFWTSLFNRGAFPVVSKPLMRVFHYCPKHAKKADFIRSRLNKARDLRNRCFHHEPLLWQPLFELHRDITELIKWIDPDLCAWIKEHDRLPAMLAEWNTWRAEAKKVKDEPAREQSGPPAGNVEGHTAESVFLVAPETKEPQAGKLAETTPLTAELLQSAMVVRGDAQVAVTETGNPTASEGQKRPILRLKRKQ